MSNIFSQILAWSLCVFVISFLVVFLTPSFESTEISSSMFETIYFNSDLPFKWRTKFAVDVGCGFGRTVEFFRKEKKIVRFHGIDFEDKITAAKEKYPDLAEYFHEGLGESIPFDDSSVDVLIFQFTFHHVEDHEKAISEISRVLKNGGYVIFIEPVIVEGKYESDDIVKFFVPDLERPEREKALEYIKKGDALKNLFVQPFERFFVFEKKLGILAGQLKGMRPEAWEENQERMYEYASQIAKEDGIEDPNDIVHFSTLRINLWKKQIS